MPEMTLHVGRLDFEVADRGFQVLGVGQVDVRSVGFRVGQSGLESASG